MARRSGRFGLLQVLWRESALERVRKCRRVPLGSGVAIRRQGQVAHYAGLVTCGSVWACPCCQAKILNHRAEEASAAAAAWHEAGHSVIMITLTMAHDDGMPLRRLVRLVADGWRHIQQGRAWVNLRKQIGLAHLIRSLEVTHGPNGWHPHLHVLAFIDGPDPAPALAALAGHIRPRWGDYWVSSGYRRPHVMHGVDLVPCYSAAEAGAYVAKLQDGRAVGNELARGDLKAGQGDHFTPLELLALFKATGDKEFLLLWREYETATKGRQRITWSKGARAELLDGAAERTDEDVAAEEVGGDLLGVITGPDWRQRIVPVPGRPAAVLDAAEAGLPVLRATLAGFGVALDEGGGPAP